MFLILHITQFNNGAISYFGHFRHHLAWTMKQILASISSGNCYSKKYGSSSFKNGKYWVRIVVVLMFMTIFGVKSNNNGGTNKSPFCFGISKVVTFVLSHWAVAVKVL